MSELNDKGLPPQREVEKQLYLYLLNRPLGVKTQIAYKELAEIMGVGPKQLRATRDSDHRNLWENLVRYAHRRLVDHGKVNSGPRGLWNVKESK